jgi:hypothetical protein
LTGGPLSRQARCVRLTVLAYRYADDATAPGGSHDACWTTGPATSDRTWYRCDRPAGHGGTLHWTRPQPAAGGGGQFHEWDDTDRAVRDSRTDWFRPADSQLLAELCDAGFQVTVYGLHEGNVPVGFDNRRQGRDAMFGALVLTRTGVLRRASLDQLVGPACADVDTHHVTGPVAVHDMVRRLVATQRQVLPQPA